MTLQGGLSAGNIVLNRSGSKRNSQYGRQLKKHGSAVNLDPAYSACKAYTEEPAISAFDSIVACMPAFMHAAAVLGKTFKGRLAHCRASGCMVEKFQRQGRLEGCRRMSAATQLILGLGKVY